MAVFHRLLGCALIVALTTNFVWFGLTFWIYLETQSVVSTGLLGGIYLVVVALSGFRFGSFTDRNKKKHVMLISSLASMVFFTIGLGLFVFAPQGIFSAVESLYLWAFALALLGGVISGSLYFIAIPILITMLVPADRRDKANGMFGTATGLAFGVNSVASGLVLGFGGMPWVLGIGIILTIVAIVYVWLLPLPEDTPVPRVEQERLKLGIRETLVLVQSVSGLLALIVFTTFNNLLSGVFFALMDAYGLNLMSVQLWGIIWGALSPAYIIGGLVISRRGLGKDPLRTLFVVNAIIWLNAVIFVLQPSIMLLTAGIAVWLSLFPVIQATEQTIIQKVVPKQKQGHVFGFAHSIEQSVAPFTAFIIGPLTQFYFIPFMTTGAGVDLIGGWFGTGVDRGIALVFILAGILGFIVTLVAMRSKVYRLLTQKYLEDEPEQT